MAKELQGRLAHLAEKPHERDEDERSCGHHGAFDENLPAPIHVEGRQAVGAVVEAAHGFSEEGNAERASQARCKNSHDSG